MIEAYCAASRQDGRRARALSAAGGVALAVFGWLWLTYGSSVYAAHLAGWAMTCL